MPTEQLITELRLNQEQFQAALGNAVKRVEQASATISKSVNQSSTAFNRQTTAQAQSERAALNLQKAQTALAREQQRLAQAQAQAATAAQRQATAQSNTERASIQAQRAAAGLAQQQQRLVQAQNQAERSAVQLSQAKVRLQNEQNRLEQSTRRSTQSVHLFSRSLLSLRTLLPTIGLSLLGKQAIETALNFQSMEIGLKTVLGSADAANKQLKFLREETERLGIRFLTSAQSFTQFVAATNAAGIELRDAQQAFLAVGEAGRVLGLSNERLKLIFLALQQIASKGTVSMEELRRQLGESLPQALGVTAQALGKTTAELIALVETGGLSAQEFFAKFPQQLRRNVAGGVAEASQTFRAAIGRFQTGFDDVLRTVGRFVTESPQVIQAINNIGAALQQLANNKGFLQALVTVFGQLVVQIELTAGVIGDLTRQSDPTLVRLNALTTEIGKVTETIAGLQAQITDIQTRSNLRGFFENLIAPNELQILQQRLDQAQAQLKSLQAMRRVLSEELIGGSGRPATSTDPSRGISESTSVVFEAVAEQARRAKAATDVFVRSLEKLDGLDIDTPKKLKADLETLQKALTDPKIREAVAKAYGLESLTQIRNRIKEVQSEIRNFASGLSESVLNLVQGPRELRKELNELEQAISTIGRENALAKAFGPEAVTLVKNRIDQIKDELSSIADIRFEELSGLDSIGTLERTIRNLEEALTLTNVPGHIDAINAELRILRQELADLQNPNLAGLHALQAINIDGPRRLKEELFQLQAVLDDITQQEALVKAFGPEALIIVQERIRAIGDELASLNDQFANLSGMDSVAELERQLARLQESLSFAQFPGEVAMVTERIEELRQEIALIKSPDLAFLATIEGLDLNRPRQLRQDFEKLDALLRDMVQLKALERIFGPEVLELAQRQLQAIKDELAEIQDVASDRTIVERQYEMAQATLRLRQSVQGLSKDFAEFSGEQEALFQDYLVNLRIAGASIEDISQMIHDRQIARIEAQISANERAAKENVRAWREASRSIGDLVETIFDAFDIGSKKTEDTIKNLLKVFETVVQQMQQVAAQNQISMNFGGQGGTTGGGLTPQQASVVASGTMYAGQVNQIAQAAGGFTYSPGGQPVTGGALGQAQGGNYLGAFSSGVQGITAGISTGQALYNSGVIQDISNFGGVGRVFGQRGANVEAGVISGAAGGAIAGTAILPGIGTIVGAIVGAVAGGIIAGLKGLPKSNRIQIQTRETAQDFEDDLARRGPFGFVGAARATRGFSLEAVEEINNFFLQLDEAAASVLTEAQRQLAENALQAQRGLQLRDFKEFDNELVRLVEDRFSTILGALDRDIKGIGEAAFAGIELREENIEELAKQYERAVVIIQAFEALGEPFRGINVRAVAQRTGRSLQELFASLEEVARVATGFQQIIDTLQAQREQLTTALGATRAFLEEALFTAAQVFERRKDQLENLFAEFEAGTPTEQLNLVGPLQALIEDVFRLAQNQDVLGEDRGRLVALQRDLLRMLADVEEATTSTIDQRIDTAQRQIDLLAQTLRVNQRQLNVLERLTTFMERAFAGSFQTGADEVKVVPRTGFGLVHAGELVSRQIPRVEFLEGREQKVMPIPRATPREADPARIGQPVSASPTAINVTVTIPAGSPFLGSEESPELVRRRLVRDLSAEIGRQVRR